MGTLTRYTAHRLGGLIFGVVGRLPVVLREFIGREVVRGLLLGSVAVGSFACQDNALTKFNNDPSASIRSPADGALVARDESFTATGTADDDDHATMDLIAAWYVDGDVVCEATVDDEGETSCDMMLTTSDAVLTLEVTDPMGATGQAQVEVASIENNLPRITIESPDATRTYYRDQKVPFLGTVFDEEDEASEMVITVESDLDGAWDVTVHEDGTLTGSRFLSEDAHMITVSATDSLGGNASEMLAITVGEPNTPPTCEILSPETGSAFDAIETVLLEGLVGDVNVDVEELTVTWVSSLDGVLGSGTPDPSGNTILPIDTLQKDTHVITLQVQDEVGERCTDFITLTVGEPPAVVIELPEEGGVYGFGEPLTIRATVTDGEDSPSSITTVWETPDDGVFAANTPDGTGVVEFATAELLPGPKTMTVTATDAGGLFSTQLVSFIVNELPSAPGVQLTSDVDADCLGTPVFSSNDLVACMTEESVDPDGDPVTYTYSWYRDAVLVEGLTENRLSASETLRGESWRVVVTPSDSLSDGYIGQSSVVIQNSAPVIEDLTVTPEGAGTLDMLTCTLGLTVDLDGDAVSYSFTWSVNGVTTPETAETLDPSYYVKNDAVSCSATPSDDSSVGMAKTSPERVIANTAPSIDSVDIGPEFVSTGDDLFCTYEGFHDPDGTDEPDNSTFRWFLNGVLAEGSTTSVYTGDFTGRDLISCEVTPTDAEDQGPPVVGIIEIDNSSPTISAVSILPSSPTAADVLRCMWSGFEDADGDEDVSGVSWSVNDVEVGTGLELAGIFSGGDTVMCTVTPYDGSAYGPAISTSILVANSVPSATAAVITPEEPRVISTLNCSPVDYEDLDPGDSNESLYRWKVNGVLASTETTLSAFDGTGSAESSDVGVACSLADSTAGPGINDCDLNCVPLSLKGNGTCDDGTSDVPNLNCSTFYYDQADCLTFVGGDTVECALTPYDLTDAGTPVVSTVVIGNTAPTISLASVSPSGGASSATATDPLSCMWSEPFDADGETVSVSVEWTIDDVIIGTGPELSFGYGAGDEVVCSVTGNDGMDDGEPVSDSIIIDNTLPTISSVQIDPDPAYASTTLVCSWSGYFDIDEDPDSSIPSWAINGLFAGVGPELSGGYVGGDIVSCTVIPSDGRGHGDALFASVTVANSPPTVDVVTVNPSDAVVGTELTCSYSGFDDVDGDSDASTYEWYVGEEETAIGVGPTVSTGFVGMETVRCEVTPSDGVDSGPPVIGTLEIGNTVPSVTDVHLDPAAPRTGDTVTCSWSGYADDDDHIDNSTNSWTVNGDPSGALTVVTGGFTAGDELACIVTPNDGYGSGEPVSHSVIVQNSAPSITSVNIHPSAPRATTPLSCNWSGYLDREGEADASTVEWFVNGESVGVGTSLDSGYVHADVVECVVTPHDGIDAGTPVTGSRTIYNTSPVIGGLTVVPAPAYRTQDLTCDWATFTDPDGEADLSEPKWKLNGIWVHELTGSKTFPAGAADEGDDIRCEVAAFDGTSIGNTLSKTVSIAPSIPSIGTASIVPNPAYVDSTLMCTWDGFYDADGDPDFTFVSWSIEGFPAGSDLELDGGFLPGDEVTCDVTPFDGTHVGTPQSVSVLIANAPPFVHDVVMTPGELFEGDVANCAPGFTTDADGTTFFEYRYKWYVDDAEVDGQTGTTLTSEYFNKDQKVHCAVNADDGLDEGPYSPSDPAWVLNSIPTITSVTLGPTGARTNDTVTATVITSDPDGDVVSASYNWYVNGVLVAALPALNGVVYFDKNDVVKVEVAPFDGEDDGDSMTSATMVIENTPPTSPTADVSPIDPLTGAEDILCTLTGLASDEDGDSLTYSIAWTRDDVSHIDTTTTTMDGDGVAASNLRAYEAWTCHLSANDGDESGIPGTAVALVQPIFLGWDTVDVGLGEADIFIDGEDEKDYSGRMVAWAGDTDGDGLSDILVAAPDNDDADSSAGKVYLVRAADVPGVTTVPLNDLTVGWTGSSDGANLGGYVQSKAMSGMGDIDGDGMADFMIGEPMYESPTTGAPNGRAYMILSSSISPTSPTAIPSIESADYIFEGPSYGQLGHAMTSIGDIDGFGTDDFIIGASNASGGKGAVYLFWGESMGATSTLYVDTDAAIEFTAEAPGDNLGLRVASAGDMDADGIPDVVIAAPNNDVGSSSKSGRAYLFFGDGITGPTHAAGADADHLLNGASSNDLAGHAMDGVGDVDKDGYDDFAISSKGRDDYGSNSGTVYVINGGLLPIFRTINLDDAWLSIGGQNAGDRAGHDVEGGGDVDGDGRGDILVSAYANDAGGSNSGRTYLLMGVNLPIEGGTMTLDSADYSFTGEGLADASGYSIAGGGDWDGDGLSDLLIGAYLRDISGSSGIVSDRGRTYLFLGPSIYH